MTEREAMGLFSRKKNKGQQQAPASPSMAYKATYVQPPTSPSDPNLPGIAGWCGGPKNAPLAHRFNYRRPDGKPDRDRGLWSDPDDPQS